MTSIYRNPDDWVSTGPMTPGTSTTTGPGPGQLGATTTTYTPGTNPGYWKGGQAPISPGPFMPTVIDDGSIGSWQNYVNQPKMSWGGEGGGYTSTDPMFRKELMMTNQPKSFDLSSIYGSRDPNQVISGQTGMPTTRATAQSTATSPSATNEQIQEYLRRQGVDPSLFGTVQANQLQYAKWGDPSNGMGDYAQREFMPTSREDYLAGIKDPTKSGEYRLSDGQFSTAHANYGLMVNPDGSFTRRVKVGDKDSVEVPYTQQADGSWVPDWQKAQAGSWDTNRGLKSDLRGMATVLGAAAGGYLANSAGVFDGITNAMNGAFPGVAGAAEGASAATPGLVELGGGGAGFTGSTAATGGATSLSALPGAGTASGGGSFLELLKEYGPKAYELVAGSPGQDGKGGSRGIIDLLAGYYSSQQNKDLSGNLKGMYSDQRGLQNPYNDLLRASYQDPNVFYNSNQWKGLESVYQNKIDRQAAKGGTIANPTDRERLLQNYAMQELERFRGGLKDAVNAYDPTRLAPIAEKGYNVEANANNPLWAGAGRAGTGGPGEGGFSTENYIKQISSTASTAEQIYNLISKWFR